MIVPNIQCYALKCARSQRCLGFNTITGSSIISWNELTSGDENFLIKSKGVQQNSYYNITNYEPIYARSFIKSAK
ncbi:hypothetical protein SNEBB_008520 [Seison nebaliae]|nr:hypothetical protein SNEBB_008520 [Seison nebaliae]